MDLDAARDHIRANPRAVLATARHDGTPQMSPVLAVVDGEGRVVISTRETAYKVGNLRRTPTAWLCVLPDSFFGTWIAVEGTAEVVSLPEALEPLVDYYRRGSGEHPDWNEYRAAMQRDHRCLVRVELTRAGPDHFG